MLGVGRDLLLFNLFENAVLSFRLCLFDFLRRNNFGADVGHLVGVTVGDFAAVGAFVFGDCPLDGDDLLFGRAAGDLKGDVFKCRTALGREVTVLIDGRFYLVKVAADGVGILLFFALRVMGVKEVDVFDFFDSDNALFIGGIFFKGLDFRLKEVVAKLFVSLPLYFWLLTCLGRLRFRCR